MQWNTPTRWPPPTARLGFSRKARAAPPRFMFVLVFVFLFFSFFSVHRCELEANRRHVTGRRYLCQGMGGSNPWEEYLNEVRHCLWLVFPLPSRLRQCLSLRSSVCLRVERHVVLFP